MYDEDFFPCHSEHNVIDSVIEVPQEKYLEENEKQKGLLEIANRYPIKYEIMIYNEKYVVKREGREFHLVNGIVEDYIGFGTKEEDYTINGVMKMIDDFFSSEM